MKLDMLLTGQIPMPTMFVIVIKKMNLCLNPSLKSTNKKKHTDTHHHKQRKYSITEDQMANLYIHIEN